MKPKIIFLIISVIFINSVFASASDTSDKKKLLISQITPDQAAQSIASDKTAEDQGAEEDLSWAATPPQTPRTQEPVKPKVSPELAAALTELVNGKVG